MQPRFVGRLGLADVVTVANAMLGFLAALVATVDTALAARLVLLAAVADGLDGVLARWNGSTPAGEFLDSLADVVSFAVAPAMIVVFVALEGWELSPSAPSPRAALVGGVAALFVAMGIVRLGLYTADDIGSSHTEGVQTTLAATILAALVLAGLDSVALLVATTLLFAYLMVTTVTYPDLYARDALAMGVVQVMAVLAPASLGRAFPRTLLVAAFAYLLFAPRYYWRER